MRQLTKGERTRQTLIEHAAALFNAKGIAGTSINDILTASGVHRSSLYSQFENKEALVYACTDHLLEQLTSHILSKMNREKSAIGKIFAFLEINRSPLTPVIPGGSPALNLSLGADQLAPGIHKRLKAVLDNYNRMFKDILSTGVSSGELSANLPIDGFSLKMCCSVQGAIAYCNIVRSNAPMQQLIESLRAELQTYSLRPE